MNRLRSTRPKLRTPGVAGLAIGLGVALLLLLIGLTWRGRTGLWVEVTGALVIFLELGLILGQRMERARWNEPLRKLARHLDAFNAQPDESWNLPASPELAELLQPLLELQGRYLLLRDRYEPPGQVNLFDSDDYQEPYHDRALDARMTLSGSFEPPIIEPAVAASGELATAEMIDRLEPRTLRWLTSTPAEQEFLGWPLVELKKKSFLEIVQEDDRKLARQEFRAVLDRGEGHGLIYRITTARGETKAVELNIGVRYGPDHNVLHLRCHLTDVTAKLRDESELKRRTDELTQANDDLRRANQQLQRLKDRYSDLYENAPAMYFTLDRRGKFVECNDTLARTLGYPKRELIGRTILDLRPEGRTRADADHFQAADRPRTIEFESEWAKNDHEIIVVWVTGTSILGSDGQVKQFRCVAQDVTTRRTLEAELRVKNDRLALANVELSIKNKELDEFTHVVSHDLQEPLRTLIAFADFLMRDQADKLDEDGKQYVRYLVEASRRLRGLIQDLLALSRAGKVTAEFALVPLDEVVQVMKSDLAELIRSRSAEVVVGSDLPQVWGDRDRIGQLLANLVSNALKYNQSESPMVEIATQIDAPSSGWITLSIQDNGIGIDPKFHARIFQLFRRLHTREEYEGNGAGLAICQKIVHAHGGRIWVESEPNQGATFFVTLPTSPAL